MRSIMYLISAFVLSFGLAAPVAAQNVVPTSKLTWDQPNVPDAPTAQGYTFKYYPDAVVTGTALASVTCSVITAPTVTCTVAFPAFTPGSHTLALTASNIAGESVKSAPLAFTFVVVPSAPNSLRIQ
jgi:hypothetical protein